MQEFASQITLICRLVYVLYLSARPIFLSPGIFQDYYFGLQFHDCNRKVIDNKDKKKFDSVAMKCVFGTSTRT